MMPLNQYRSVAFAVSALVCYSASQSGERAQRAEDARVVVAAIVQAAEKNSQLPPRNGEQSLRRHRLTGDALTEHYFRCAAAAAQGLPPGRAASAFLVGITVAMDSTQFFRNNHWTRDLWRLIESEEQRAHRISVLGKPTMRGRRDLAQHFAISAGLTALMGAEAAEAAGLVKEYRDVHDGKVFSFVDLSADLAGIRFARHVLDSGSVPAEWATSFQAEHYLPDPKDFRDDVSADLKWDEFADEFGLRAAGNYRAAREVILRQLAELPGYRQAGDEDRNEGRVLNVAKTRQRPESSAPDTKPANDRPVH